MMPTVIEPHRHLAAFQRGVAEGEDDLPGEQGTEHAKSMDLLGWVAQPVCFIPSVLFVSKEQREWCRMLDRQNTAFQIGRD
jgi:hypothetical protein